MKTRYIVMILGAGLLLLFLVIIVFVQNTAIGYEETINNDKSALQVQAQRRFDLITKLVEVVAQDSQYEASTLQSVTQMRTALKSGNVTQAQTLLNATFEAYPDLKATQSYAQLMTELSTTENMMAQYRNTYNDDVQNYHQFVRRFPASSVLSLTGYKIQDYSYLTFADNSLPDQLFPPAP